MKIAKIGDLRNRLSYFLRFVRRGQSVVVCDRDRVIARIVPVRDAGTVAGTSVWPGYLIESGVLAPPSTRLRQEWFKKRPKTRVDVVATLLQERASAR